MIFPGKFIRYNKYRPYELYIFHAFRKRTTYTDVHTYLNIKTATKHPVILQRGILDLDQSHK